MHENLRWASLKAVAVSFISLSHRREPSLHSSAGAIKFKLGFSSVPKHDELVIGSPVQTARSIHCPSFGSEIPFSPAATDMDTHRPGTDTSQRSIHSNINIIRALDSKERTPYQSSHSQERQQQGWHAVVRGTGRR